jgi:rhodanese-related sulfurtransferase
MSSPFHGQGLLINGVVFLSPREALPLCEAGAVMVDLRLESERNGRAFALPAVIERPYLELAAALDELPRDRPLILADCVGIRSKAAVPLLCEHGFETLAVLNGGMVDWDRDGMPIVLDRDAQLTGSCTCQLRPARVYRGTGC